MPNQLQTAAEMYRLLQMMAQGANLPDEKALEVANLFEPWAAGKVYLVGHRVKYGVNVDGETQLYRVVQTHTSQADWTPDKTPAMYQAVGFTEAGVSIWTQPLGAHDAYNKGDVVSHKDKLWVSDSDGNVWEPGVHGWSEKK